MNTPLGATVRSPLAAPGRGKPLSSSPPGARQRGGHATTWKRLAVFAGAARMGRKAALLVAARMIQNPDLTLALPTGETPLRFYAALVRLHREFGLDFSRATLFNLDEYVGLDTRDRHSFATYMRNNLLDRVNIARGAHHIPDTATRDARAEARRYAAMIRAAGGITLAVLGIGTNGHIAFNEPGDTFTQGVVTVELAPATRLRAARHFGDVSRVPREAITMGIGTILSAHEILVLASGRAKAEALSAALTGPRTPAMPASALQDHPRVTVFADRSAVRDLGRRDLPAEWELDERDCR